MIRTVFYNKDEILYADLKQKGKSFLLKEQKSESVENLKEVFKEKRKYYFSTHVSDINFVKVEIPIVNDENTKLILIKNKLKSTIPYIEQYKIFPNSEKIEEDREIFNVYLIPYEIWKDFPVKKEFEIFSLPFFSLNALSNYYFKEKNILHIYIDHNEITLNFNESENFFYFRTVDIPQTEMSEDDLVNLCYQNINLTYNYLIHTLSMDIDYIIFSGPDIKSKLPDLVYKLTETPIVSILPYNLIKNCSPEIFQRYIVCFGNLLIKYPKYDIRPDEEIYKTNFYHLIKILGRVAILILVLSVGFLYFNYKQFKLLESEMASLNSNIQLILDKQKRETKLSPEEINYYVNYLNFINKSQKNAILPLKYILPLLNIIKFEEIKSRFNQGNFVVDLKSQLNFNSLIEQDKFKRKLENIINQIKQNNVNIKNESEFDINKLTANIKINIKVITP